MPTVPELPQAEEGDFIDKHARRVGIDPAWMRKIMRIESGGDPSQQTGSYKGLFQLSEKEFRRHGGSGSIFDPEQNTAAAANKLAQEKLNFKIKYDRDPTLKDIYMIHQQGEAGYAAHMANPDAPAWQNMLSTAEGKQKGAAWAKTAIWGNLSSEARAKYGSVENVTSADFTGEWGGKIEGTAQGSVRRARGGVAKEGYRVDYGEEEPEEEPKPTKPPPEFEPVPVDTSLRFGQFTPELRSFKHE